MVAKFEVEERNDLKQKPDQDNLSFGIHFTDYMFAMDYSEEFGWHNKKIVPYEDIPMSPASQVLHYGQAVFEGLKHIKRLQAPSYFVRMKILNV